MYSNQVRVKVVFFFFGMLCQEEWCLWLFSSHVILRWANSFSVPGTLFARVPPASLSLFNLSQNVEHLNIKQKRKKQFYGESQKAKRALWWFIKQKKKKNNLKSNNDFFIQKYMIHLKQKTRSNSDSRALVILVSSFLYIQLEVVEYLILCRFTKCRRG